VAALLVLVHHSASSSIKGALSLHGHPALGTIFFWTTGSGVELFFVLSGVVLLRPYVRRERDLDVAAYFRRRVERLMPPYLGAWALAGLVVALAGWTPSWFSSETHMPAFTWSGWLGQAFILRFRDTLYNDAWWSLAVEVLFYVLVPLVVLASAARRLRLGQALIGLALAAAFSSAVTALFSVEHLPLAMFYSLGAYASCFCGGILIARFDLPQAVPRVLCGLGVLWVLAAAAVWPQLNGHVGYGLFYTGLVQRALAAGQRQSLLSTPLAVWLGERSYSLFLVHVSVFQLVDHAAAHAWTWRSSAYLLATRLVGLPLSLLIAMVLFTLVERRFARGLVTSHRFWPPVGAAAWRPIPARSSGAPAPVPGRGSAVPGALET
jgi:peptidoglycan/LPS O-acetylase OafA/YrhL